MQERYWEKLLYIKSLYYYFNLYNIQSERIENSLNIFLALFSSTSIAAWAIWGKFPILWSIFIASTQVIKVIHSYLPFKERTKILPGLALRFEELSISFEKDWLDVAEGNFTAEEINDKIFKLNSDIYQIQNGYLKKITFPHKNKLQEKAYAYVEHYFSSFH